MSNDSMPQASSTGDAILVADPGQGSQQEIRAVLYRAGYRTRGARNRAEVVAAVSSLQPQIVLLDHSLPDADGLDLCRQLKVDGGLRVILMSGEPTSSDDIADGLEAGAKAYLVKPFGARELLAHVKAHVKGFHRERRCEARERRLQGLFQDAPDGCFIIENGGFVEVNQRGLELFGYDSADELIGKGPAEISAERQLDGQSSQKKAEAVFAALSPDTPQYFEWVHRRKDGTEFLGDVSVSDIGVAGEQVVQAIVRDMTERKRLMNELEEARNFLHTIVEQSPVPMWVGDSEGTLIHTNKALRTAVRTSEEDLVGIYNPLKDPNVERAGLTDTIRRVLEEKEPAHFTLLWRPEEYWGKEHGGARERYMETSMFPVVVNGKLQLLVTQWVDVTDRMHLEHELREKEEKLRAVVENSSNIFYSHGTVHVLTYMSPQVKRVLGYEVEEALIRWTELATDHPANAQAFKMTEKAIQTGEAQPVYEVQVRHKDGRLVWLEVRESPAVENGKTVAMVGSLTDITARKAGADALRESNTLYQDLLSSLASGVVLHAPDTSVQMANPAAERILGLSKAQMLGKQAVDPDWSFLGDDGRKLQNEEYPVSQVISTKKAFRNLVRGVVRPKTDDVVWVLVNSVPVFNEEGEIDRIVISFVDITERRMGEEALRESEARKALATRSVGIGIWDWDVVTNRIQWDQQMFRLYGVTAIPDKVTYEYWHDRVHPDDVEAAAALVEATLRGEIDFDVEFRIVWPNGAVRWIKGMAVAFRDEEGKPVRMLGTNYDITEAKEAVEALRLANQAKDEFLAVMSHDLRSPLNPILGFTSLLLEEASGEDAAMLELINSSGERMLTLIDSLLEYARLDRSVVKPSVQPFNLLHACRTVFTEVSHGNEEIGGTFNNGDAQLSPVDETLEVNSDRTILMRILGNLLQNAYKYTEAGSVTFTLGQMTHARGGAEFRFVIEDTGIGIDEALISSLFDPFSQADCSYERSNSGVGLGLAICNKLVGLLGGEIEVSSQHGVGSRFTVTLTLEPIIPERSAPEKEREKAAGKLTLRRDLRVLIVDDEASNATMAKMMVKRLGGVPVLAGSGSEAIELCQKELFDVILMDLRMPEVNGFQATERIRANSQLNAGTPIVAATANVSTEIECKCRELGISGFLKKPMSIEDLFHELSKFL